MSGGFGMSSQSTAIPAAHDSLSLGLGMVESGMSTGMPSSTASAKPPVSAAPSPSFGGMGTMNGGSTMGMGMGSSPMTSMGMGMGMAGGSAGGDTNPFDMLGTSSGPAVSQVGLFLYSHGIRN